MGLVRNLGGICDALHSQPTRSFGHTWTRSRPCPYVPPHPRARARAFACPAHTRARARAFTHRPTPEVTPASSSVAHTRASALAFTPAFFFRKYVIMERFGGWSFAKYVIMERFDGDSTRLPPSTANNHVFA